jgi:4-diphosphocytidyl-2-C-methyl-D-erythritol kinase
MGGGSMNVSNIINFLIKKKFLKISKKKIEKISNLIGSDVILGINSKEKTINSKYNFIKIVKKLSLNLVIIKPSFGCSTKTIYSNINSFSKTKLKIIRNSSVKKSEILKLNNDLEVPAFKKYIKLRSLKSYLSKLKNVFFVRMTGSGSAIVVYFRSEKAALIALKAIKRKYKNYWCIISKTI